VHDSSADLLISCTVILLNTFGTRHERCFSHIIYKTAQASVLNK